MRKNQEAAASTAPTLERRPDNPKYWDDLVLAVKEMFYAPSDGARAEAFKAAFDILESQPHQEYNEGDNG